MSSEDDVGAPNSGGRAGSGEHTEGPSFEDPKSFISGETNPLSEDDLLDEDDLTEDLRLGSDEIPAGGGQLDGGIDPEIGAEIDDALDDAADAIFSTGESSALVELRGERDEYLDSLQRLQAEFDNYRKRVQRDQDTLQSLATERLVGELLPVLDSFELALTSIQDGSETDDLAKVRKGIELVYGELLGTLEKWGLERIVAAGHPFNAEEQEAVMQVDATEDVPEGHVVDVVRSGYRYNARVLRPAMVKVAK